MFCLKLSEDAKNTLKGFFFLLFFLLSILFPLLSFAYISEVDPAEWVNLAFAGISVGLAWVSLGIQQLGKWFISNIERC
jgi:hypothetical protein